MDKKKLILLVGALVIAIGTAFAARSMFTGASAPEVQAAELEPQGPKVLVAKRGLPIGTIITAEAVGYQLWPQEMVQDAYFIDGEADMSKLMGTVVRHATTAGEPITQGSLVAPGDRGFLAAALGPGMRAVTVTVSDKAGVAGFVFPGDRIDLMLTQSVSGEDDGPELKASETILTNLRVLATDQSTSSRTTEEGLTVVQGFTLVTMEVTPKIAEKIAVAETIGSLSLVLRSIADNQAELESAIASGAVELPENATKEEEEALLRKAVSLPQTGAKSFVTGGDVSRFQRKSMPSQTAKSGQPSAPFKSSAPTNNARAIASSAPQPIVPTGPVVRVTRGKSTTSEAAGPNNRATVPTRSTTPAAYTATAAQKQAAANRYRSGGSPTPPLDR